MEARVARLEAEIQRLRAEIEVLKFGNRRMDPIDRALSAGFALVTAVLLGGLAIGFGWI